MTTARQAVRSAAPRPAPREERITRPRLRVLKSIELTPKGRRRRARLMATGVVATVVVGLFGIAVFNVLLTQGQARLNAIDERAASQQDRYERLRLEVAQLESPERVVAAAQERLGMVPPASVTYLAPGGPTSDSAIESQSAEPRPSDPSTPVTSDWAQVKPHLVAQP